MRYTVHAAPDGLRKMSIALDDILHIWVNDSLDEVTRERFIREKLDLYGRRHGRHVTATAVGGGAIAMGVAAVTVLPFTLGGDSVHTPSPVRYAGPSHSHPQQAPSPAKPPTAPHPTDPHPPSPKTDTPQPPGDTPRLVPATAGAPNWSTSTPAPPRPRLVKIPKVRIPKVPLPDLPQTPSLPDRPSARQPVRYRSVWSFTSARTRACGCGLGADDHDQSDVASRHAP